MGKKITKDIVKRARARALANPSILIQGRFATDEYGMTCDVESPRASCFCTLGLIANEAGLKQADLEVGDGTENNAYGGMAKMFGDKDREVRVDCVIEKTDDKENLVKKVVACNGQSPVAGLAGFDYLLSTM